MDEISDKYSAAGGIIEEKADAVIEQYMKEIDGIDPSGSQSLDELEKISFRKIDIFTQYEKSLQREIVAECDRSLIEFSTNAGINYTVIKPDLTPEVVKKIRDEQKAKNTETRYYTTGNSLSKRTESYIRRLRMPTKLSRSPTALRTPTRWSMIWRKSGSRRASWCGTYATASPASSG